MFEGYYAVFFCLRIIGSRAFVHEKRHCDKLHQNAWEDIKYKAVYNNDNPTYITCLGGLALGLRVRWSQTGASDLSLQVQLVSPDYLYCFHPW